MGCVASVPEHDLDAVGKSCRGPATCNHGNNSGTKPATIGIGQTERLLSRRLQEETGKNNNDEEQKAGEERPPSLNASGQLMPEEVVKRTCSSIQNQSMTLGTPKNVIQVDYAYWTQRGYYPDNPHKENQDEFSITTKFASGSTDALLAVYDGHGAEGHSCSRFCKKQLPKILAKYMRQKRVKKYKEQLAKKNDVTTKKFFDPSRWPFLDKEEVEECCRQAYIECNEMMHQDPQVLDKMSGTTGTAMLFHGDLLTVSNVGDSRAILGHRVAKGESNDGHALTREAASIEEEKMEETEEEEKKYEELDRLPSTLLAIPLSRDQTPYRKDERERVMKAGASIKSIDQMEGRADMHDNWGDVVLGKDVDFHGDPPRVWAKGKDYPGCAFTRSLGDSFSEQIGIHAEPEMLTRQLTRNDEILIVASDGIFEFVTNQAVMDICADCETPLEACERVVRTAYDQWLTYEKRTDDITIIVCFLQCSKQPNDLQETSRAMGAGTTEDLVELVKTVYGNELQQQQQQQILYDENQTKTAC